MIADGDDSVAFVGDNERGDFLYIDDTYSRTLELSRALASTHHLISLVAAPGKLSSPPSVVSVNLPPVMLPTCPKFYGIPCHE
jgi:hypothetical protein